MFAIVAIHLNEELEFKTLDLNCSVLVQLYV